MAGPALGVVVSVLLAGAYAAPVPVGPPELVALGARYDVRALEGGEISVVQDLGREAWLLPLEIDLVEPATPGSDATTPLRPTIYPEPLTWDVTRKRFRGALRLALVDAAHPEPRALPSPFSAQLTSPDARIEPATVPIPRTNDPVVVTMEYEGEADAVEVALDVLGLDAPVALRPAVVRRILSIEVFPATVQGFGLEAATVRVSSEGAEDVQASLSASSGRLSETAVSLGSPGREVELRSAGVGAVTLGAGAPGFRTSQATVQFAWPIAFGLSSVAGGAAGGTLKGLLGGAKERASRLTRAVGVGMVAALVVAVAAALGVNVTGVSLGSGLNEAAVFLVSAIGAYGADTLVDRVLGGPG